MRRRRVWSVSVIVVAFVVTSVWSGGVGAVPGDLDPTFGTAGQTTVPGTALLDYNPRLMIDADGTIVGRAGRLTTADGTPITSNLSQPPGGYSVVSAGVQPDGRVVLVYLVNGDARLWVTRLLRSGAVDPSFATGFLPLNLFVPGNGALFFLADGRILVAHSMLFSCVGVFRLSVLGTVDTTYGTNGIAKTCAIRFPTELVASVMMMSCSAATRTRDLDRMRSSRSVRTGRSTRRSRLRACWSCLRASTTPTRP
jgi:hypothetical protein